MNAPAIWAVLDNIRSRENVGSIFRTADAAGVGKLYLCGITPRPPHEKISKTALGAEKTVSWEYHTQAWRLVERLRAKENAYIVALEKTSNSENIFALKLPSDRPIVLVVGNEVEGLAPRILARADTVVAIPMRGEKESLNVAVAFGVAVYQLIR
ncbi:MAG TPA: TrmH family RNA methyltransferase [Candidatus Paceibacterota bacterium]|nr:TrmH family RNA methyltransferase [Candidatus Paceibacterota bacterium]